MEHRHLDAAALEDLLATDRTAKQNEQLFHLLAVCPRCREVGGWLLELHQAAELPSIFRPPRGAARAALSPTRRLPSLPRGRRLAARASPGRRAPFYLRPDRRRPRSLSCRGAPPTGR